MKLIKNGYLLLDNELKKAEMLFDETGIKQIAEHIDCLLYTSLLLVHLGKEW